MRIKKDLKNFIVEKLPGYVESHIQAWVGHYAGMSASEAAREFDINYDWGAELETLSEGLGRELSENEEGFLLLKYLKIFKEVYGDSMQEGYRLQTGYYLNR